MIKAADARKVTLEAQEARKKKQTLEESRRLEKLFAGRMKDADQTVQAAMKRGEDRTTLRFEHEIFPEALKERFKLQVEAAGYSCLIHPNDDNDGVEISLVWCNPHDL